VTAAAEELPWLAAPWYPLDLPPGVGMLVRVQRLELGRIPPIGDTPSASWPFTTSRLHLHEDGPVQEAPYVDVIGRKVAEILRGALAHPPAAGVVVTIRRTGNTWPPGYSITIAPH